MAFIGLVVGWEFMTMLIYVFVECYLNLSGGGKMESINSLEYEGGYRGRELVMRSGEL